MIDEELLRTLASTDAPTTIRPLPQIAARTAVLRRRRRATTAVAALAAGVAALAVVTGPLTGKDSSLTHLREPAATATPSAAPSVAPTTSLAIAPPAAPTHRASTSVPDTQVHAKFVSLKSGMIAYNEVQWFDGKAAVRECRKDGLKSAGAPWCLAYYYRDTNPRVRRLPVAKDVVIKVCAFHVPPNADSRLTRVTLSQLEKFEASSDPVDVVVLTIKNGEITELDEVFEG
jgi:hypothetical protein